MKSNNIYEDLFVVRRRTKRVFAFIGIILIFLILNFWKIQVLEHEKYWQKSESNRTRSMVLPFQRGLIRDRNGNILANNRGSFKVSVIRENCKDYDKSWRKIARLLRIEENVLKERIKKYESFPLFKPIVIKENLTLDEVAFIEARKLEFPELILETEPKRYYVFGNFAAHVLGYLQELSPPEVKRGVHQERNLGDLVGKTGVEKMCESLLAGSNGEAVEVVDSSGRPKGEIARREPKKGQDIILSLDFKLQKKAEELLEGREGAIIVLDPRDGEVLTLASYPDFDPNKFITRFTPEEWLGLVNSPSFPLENRAIRGLYSPGSIFKLTMALGALDLGLIDEETTFFCSGKTRIYGQSFSCWAEQGHGSMNLYTGIRNSCNIYFYQLGKMMGIEEISRYARMLGFEAKTGIDLPNEKTGLVPDPRWKKEALNEPWQSGETISVSIGQGPLLVTPLQVACHTAIIANRGRDVIPHLLKSPSLEAKKGKDAASSSRQATEIDPMIFEKVIRGMWESVNNGGTGRAARVEGFDVCGKTGSTQVMSKEMLEKLKAEGKEVKTHSWFTGFGPKDSPQVVVTVIVEFGGTGGATAAPLAREMFELYRKNYD